MSNTRRPRNPQLGKEPAPRATALIVSLVVLVCIGAVVAIAVLLKGGNDNTAAPGTSTSGATVTQTAPSTDESTSPVNTGLDCSSAPPTPGETQQYDNPPPKTLADGATWTATLHTNCGDIVMSLNGKAAPQTVSSFVFLAQKHYFDDTPCHRLTTASIYVLQCGDPTGQGSGGPGYGFGIENAPANGDYPRGTLAMARASDPNSNGSQFFIVYQDTKLPTTGGGYSIFGRVTQGLDIVQGIARGGVVGGSGDGRPAQPISILSVKVKKA